MEEAITTIIGIIVPIFLWGLFAFLFVGWIVIIYRWFAGVFGAITELFGKSSKMKDFETEKAPKEGVATLSPYEERASQPRVFVVKNGRIVEKEDLGAGRNF